LVAIDNKRFLKQHQAKSMLTIEALTLSPINVYAVEVAQSSPKLPSQDIVPPSSPAPPPQQAPVPSPTPTVPQLPTPELPNLSPEFTPEIPTIFFVTKFEFMRSTVFTDEELLQTIEKALVAGGDHRFCQQSPNAENQPVTSKHPCQKLPRTEKDPPIELTFAQMLEARSAITQLYINKDYITSGALIPEQKLPPGGGSVKIKIVEGILEGIKITGTRRLNPSYVRSRLAVATKKPLNRKRLLEALQLLQLDPRIKSLSADLAAGSRLGSSLLTVKVNEANTFHSSINLDNSRSPSVGSFQRSTQLREDNLFGLGDTISLFYANTDGSNKVDFNYTFPLTPQNTTLTFSYGYTSNHIIEKPFNRLDIISKSHEYKLSLRHPIIQTPTQEFALGLALTNQRTQTFLGLDNIGGFRLSPGADDKGRTYISALRFFQDWTQRNDVSVLALRSQFSFGLPILDSTINNVDPDSEFFAWRGQAQWVRRLATDTLLVLRGDVQLTDRSLVSLEQFGLGGLASVRGYRQDQLLTDNGAFGSIELRLPILRASEPQSLLQLIPFVDFGTVWNVQGSNPKQNTLASIGFGLRYQFSHQLDARLDWGIPLISVDHSNKQTLQEKGLYFSLLWNFF
jgi:hemolysin activation/secretion protein